MKDTSLLAHDKIIATGRAFTLRGQALRFLQAHPGTTQREITSIMGESARKRVNELVAEGMVEETGKREIEGLQYTTYRAVTEENQQRLAI